MALETLKNLTEIGGYKVVCQAVDIACTKVDGSTDWKKFDEYRKDYPIHITHDKNMISFKIQDGPIKEFGVNGCQVDTLIRTARIIVDGLNKKYPCRENSLAITKLDEAILWLEARTRDRETRGVEGYSKA